MKFIKVGYSDHHNWHQVYSWCEDNCTGNWYGGSDWDNWVVGEENGMIEFESEKDAVMFALRWS